MSKQSTESMSTSNTATIAASSTMNGNLSISASILFAAPAAAAVDPAAQSAGSSASTAAPAAASSSSSMAMEAKAPAAAASGAPPAAQEAQKQTSILADTPEDSDEEDTGLIDTSELKSGASQQPAPASCASQQSAAALAMTTEPMHEAKAPSAVLPEVKAASADATSAPTKPAEKIEPPKAEAKDEPAKPAEKVEPPKPEQKVEAPHTEEKAEAAKVEQARLAVAPLVAEPAVAKPEVQLPPSIAIPEPKKAEAKKEDQKVDAGTLPRDLSPDVFEGCVSAEGKEPKSDAMETEDNKPQSTVSEKEADENARRTKKRRMAIKDDDENENEEKTNAPPPASHSSSSSSASVSCSSSSSSSSSSALSSSSTSSASSASASSEALIKPARKHRNPPPWVFAPPNQSKENKQRAAAYLKTMTGLYDKAAVEAPDLLLNWHTLLALIERTSYAPGIVGADILWFFPGAERKDNGAIDAACKTITELFRRIMLANDVDLEHQRRFLQACATHMNPRLLITTRWVDLQDDAVKFAKKHDKEWLQDLECAKALSTLGTRLACACVDEAAACGKALQAGGKIKKSELALPTMGAFITAQLLVTEAADLLDAIYNDPPAELAEQAPEMLQLNECQYESATDVLKSVFAMSGIPAIGSDTTKKIALQACERLGLRTYTRETLEEQLKDETICVPALVTMDTKDRFVAAAGDSLGKAMKNFVDALAAYNDKHVTKPAASRDVLGISDDEDEEEKESKKKVSKKGGKKRKAEDEDDEE